MKNKKLKNQNNWPTIDIQALIKRSIIGKVEGLANAQSFEGCIVRPSGFKR